MTVERYNELTARTHQQIAIDDLRERVCRLDWERHRLYERVYCDDQYLETGKANPRLLRMLNKKRADCDDAEQALHVALKAVKD